jgi:NADH-quinone oxidoreductase subunit G
MPIINIDGTDHEFENGLTLIQACEQVGIEIPRFCYHERLEIAGNCRMCLVESVGAPKPVASCAMGVNDLRPGRDGSAPKIRTNSEMVKKAREGVMEFMLINHPLDCPICDQGGECDLQDQAMYYGKGESRYEEMKRAVQDKYMGPLIKTHMTRCIHCTRCIRFTEDVAGVPDLGATGRGEYMEVTTYVEKAISSELSGNIIDLCPVGALTSKPYAFAARPWELTKVETIDVHDAVGSNIRVDVRGNSVLRVLPRLNEAINEEWISDKTRFACDGLKLQRLDKPYVRKNGALVPASWDEAFAVIAKQLAGLSGTAIAALSGNLACVESMKALKDFMHQLGSDNMDCRQDGALLPTEHRSDYLFNTTIAGIEEADFILIIGSNVRLEAALINARIRKRYLRGGVTIANIGVAHDLTYPAQELGNNTGVLNEIIAGSHEICAALAHAQRPMVIVGSASLAGADGADLHHAAKILVNTYPAFIQEGWNGFNVLHHAAARVGGLDIGFVPTAGGRNIDEIIHGIEQQEIKFLYLLGVDDIDAQYFGDAFVVYQGHHGDIGAARADVVLPGLAYTEKNAMYVNTEGRPQYAYQAAFPLGEAKEDWKIIRALSEHVGCVLPYNTLAQLREAITQQHPHFAHMDEVVTEAFVPADGQLHLSSHAFYDFITNYYMTDVISRVSPTMAACSREIGSAKGQEAA